MDSVYYYLLFILISLLLSYFFSSVETAFTAMNIAKINEAKSRGIRSAQTALELNEKKSQVIGTILLGNTLVNILSTSMATALFTKNFGTEIGVISSSLVMTIVILLLAEILPKTYAINNPERVILFTASTVKTVDFILSPFTKSINKLVTCVTKMLNLNISATEDTSTTSCIRAILSMHKSKKDGKNEGKTAEDTRIIKMLSNILDISKLDISHVMLHKDNIVSVDISMSNPKIIKKCFESGHSRIPFWEDTPSNIIGILHVKDLAIALFKKNKSPDNINIKSLLTPPIFIPNTVTVEEQLLNFRKQKRHLAIIVDEYGDLNGLVTLEDAIEEIVGEIHDEHDIKKTSIVKLKDGSYNVLGTTSIRDINRDIGLSLNATDSSTVAGFIMNDISRIPNEGEFIKIDKLTFTIIKKTKNRIHKVNISQTS